MIKRETLRYERLPGSGDLVFAKDLSSDIGMSQWKAGAGSLLTTGASTCIILAAHNGETHRGLIGHFGAIIAERGGYEDGDMFRQAIEEVLRLGGLDTTSVWLGGGAPNIYKGRDNVAEDRQYSQEKVEGMGVESVIEWSPAGHVIDAELDCQSGILVVHDYPETAVSLGSRAARASLNGL